MDRHLVVLMAWGFLGGGAIAVMVGVLIAALSRHSGQVYLVVLDGGDSDPELVYSIWTTEAAAQAEVQRLAAKEMYFPWNSWRVTPVQPDQANDYSVVL